MTIYHQHGLEKVAMKPYRGAGARPGDMICPLDGKRAHEWTAAEISERSTKGRRRRKT